MLEFHYHIYFYYPNDISKFVYKRINNKEVIKEIILVDMQISMPASMQYKIYEA